jgi:hypothetical protein
MVNSSALYQVTFTKERYSEKTLNRTTQSNEKPNPLAILLRAEEQTKPQQRKVHHSNVHALLFNVIASQMSLMVSSSASVTGSTVTRVAQEGQMPFGAFVGVVTLATALVARDLFKRLLGPAGPVTARPVMHTDTVMGIPATMILPVHFLAHLLLAHIRWHLVAVNCFVSAFSTEVAGDHHLFAFLGLHILNGWQLESWTEIQY